MPEEIAENLEPGTVFVRKDGSIVVLIASLDYKLRWRCCIVEQVMDGKFKDGETTFLHWAEIAQMRMLDKAT